MTYNSDVFTRRILNFPAIRPCEFVSFSSLLTSLINLGRTICEYKSKTFFVNIKNARNAIRFVQNLLIFLEEIPLGISTCVTNSATLSLSELHFILQKVQYLLEDCTRDDARLWMLTQSQITADEFRVLIRAMGVALDVLPLEEMELGDEVNGLVEFVKDQALALKFETEVDDQRFLRKVFWILDHFGGGIDPKPSDVRKVLEYLGIGSWSECNREVKFLEDEIGLESQSEKKSNIRLLNSLMGFMIYCRSILFEYVDKVTSKRTDNLGSCDTVRCLNADDFRCPITLELMSDPVTIATGHTYERSSILKWFRAGNRTCPKTGQRLLCTDFVPNAALKQLIKGFCSEKGIHFADSVGRSRDVTKAVVAGSKVSEQAVRLLANFLVGRLVGCNNQEQNRAAYEIRLLTKTSIFNRSCLVEAGTIPPLLNLLFSCDPSLQENAMASLLNLSKFSKSRKIIVENGGLILILDVLKCGLKVEARQHAAGAFFYLASAEEYRQLIGEIPDAIPSLVELVRDGADRGKKNALVTIFGLLLCPENHRRVFAAGLVPLLVDLISSCEREDLVTDSLAVLANLADNPDGTTSILSSGALPMIVEVLGSSSSMAAREYCVSLLLSFCTHGGADAVIVLVKNPSLMGALYSQLTEGTTRASKKASSLIKILHNFNEKSTFGFSNPVLPQERFIHVW
ncbi:unnamed protein product [Coffea canephora]|uniref:RING-type E3 ubiquitin transferase n=1 Tax=Coffea canephora TaxID=49390 RepID=A0A068TW10_COFCA|nr:unnamed protein product [Coffea canephora]